jgi:A/G-specific adenine glycosylase
MGHRSNPTPADPLLAWFLEHRRPLPWREPLPPGPIAEALHRDRAYTFLVIETMAQQTRLETVLQRLSPFLLRYPSVARMATSAEATVLGDWAGLGYYRRARNLHAAARLVTARHGIWPQGEAGWRTLPGVGPYTAAALAAQVEGLALPAIDGNVRRVGARLLGIPNPSERALREALAARFGLHGEPDAAGALRSEGLIELGALLCTPRQPRCHRCPLRQECVAANLGRAESFPAPRERPAARALQLHAHLVLDPQGQIALERRPDDGLWPGTWGLPWREAPPPAGTGRAELLGRFSHALTHRRIDAHVWRTSAPPHRATTVWRPRSEASKLPTIDQRALALLATAEGGALAVR